MTWIGAKYGFASTFSYRLPDFSSSYALAAPAPSPSTIKLAIVAMAIKDSCSVDEGRNIFELLKTTDIQVELPHRIAAFKSFLKRLKPKRRERGFESTFGIREYLVYSDVLTVYMDLPENTVEKLLGIMKKISYFGTSDSLCTCLKIDNSEPIQERCISPFNEQKNGLIFLLTDFSEDTTFEYVDPYAGVNMKGSEYLKKIPYHFPLTVLKKESNYTIYERIS
jgi:hypothetical protein